MLEIIEAPSNLGLRPPAPGREPGVRRMPDALRAAGLHARLAPAAVRRVEPPPYGFDLDPALGVRNADAVADYSRRLADAVDEALAAGRLPLVLGGDCSVLLGSLLGLGRHGRHGPLRRRPHRLRHAGHEPHRRRGRHGPRHRLRARAPAPRPPRERGRPTSGFWLHVDLDVVDSALLPAVDSPQPDGLSWDDLERLLRLARGAPGFRGAEITIFDPDLDPAGRLAARLADVIAGGLG